MTDEGRPIETAPTDGSEFLAYDPVAKCFDVCVVRQWGRELRMWPTQKDGEYGPLEDDFQVERATLWWPLPVVGDGE